MALDDRRARDLRNAGRKTEEWRARRDDLIKEAYESGGSLREIGEAVGLSHVAVMKIIQRLSPVPVEADHIVPLNQGGTTGPDNIQIVARSENRRRKP